MMKKGMVSVVIPLYNSSKTIQPVIEEIREEFKRIGTDNYEIVLVNDCSPDNVLDVVTEMARQDRRIKVASLAKNMGQTTAMIAGYTYASGEFIVNMDDDYQMPGFEIGRLLQTLIDGDYDVVFAKYRKQKESKFRRFGSDINCKMAEIMIGKPKSIRSNSFFIMRSFIRDEIIKYSNHYPYVYGIIFASTSKIANVETEHRKRENGKSNYSFGKLLGLWLNGFLNFSVRPLRISTVVGAVVSAVSAVIAVVLAISRIYNPDGVAGWTSIVIIILFFAGLQLISIGLLGEYLGRLYISSSNLPKYVVRKTFNIDEDAEPLSGTAQEERKVKSLHEKEE